MNGTMEQNVLKLEFSGHIDSSNAPAAEAEALAQIEAQPHEGLILDCQDLTYISSAGLRVVLHLRKLEPELKLVNVSSEGL